MTTPRKTILIFLPVLALISLALYRQFTRPVSLGTRVHQLLSAADGQTLGAALPLIVDQSNATPEARWVLLPAAELDTQTYVAFGQWRLVRHHNQPWPERGRLSEPRVTDPLRRALGEMGYVNNRPRELFDATRRDLETLSDGALLMAMIQADVAVLEQRGDLDAALREALLLRGRDFTGAAVTIPLPEGVGQLFVLEPSQSSLSANENMAFLRCVDAAGRGLWQGTLTWPRQAGVDSRGEEPTPGGMLRAFLESGR